MKKMRVLLTSKADLLLVKNELILELKRVEARLDSKINTQKHESRIYFVILICLLVLLNKDSIILIGQLLGAIK